MEEKMLSRYFDYKSPFAYLAKDGAYKLEDDYHVRIGWLPYVLNIPEACYCCGMVGRNTMLVRGL